MMKQVEERIAACRKCQKDKSNHPEPLKSTQMPNRPWQYLATDLFEHQKLNFLLVADYYSGWLEMFKLSNMTSSEIIRKLKSTFSRYGIPDQVRSDNARYYTSGEFQTFSKDYGFNHITSSPLHSSGNGYAERMVAVAKKILQSEDPHIALLNYRSAPLACGYSPSELLQSRRLKTQIPISPNQLLPSLVDSNALDTHKENKRLNMESNFNMRHAAAPLSELKKGDEVYIPDRKETGIIQSQVHPRSYEVTTGQGEYRRNRVQLNKLPPTEDTDHVPSPPVMSSPGRTPQSPVTSAPSPRRSGRTRTPPSYLKDFVKS